MRKQRGPIGTRFVHGRHGRIMRRFPKWLQATVVVCLTLVYCAFVFHPGPSLPSKSIYSPVAYLVLVLSSLWWGRRALGMAALLGLVVLVPVVTGAEAADPWGDAVRTASFFVVALGLGAVRDQIVKAHKAQRASEEQYRDIVEKSLAGIFIYRDDTVLFANSRFREFLGYGPDEVVGRSFWGFIHKDDRAKVRDHLTRREAGDATDLRYECRLIAKDGQTVWADIVSSSVEYEGNAAVLVSVYDITEREEINQQRRELSRLARRQEEQLVHSTRLAEMGEVAAGIAHELNQPLTGIKNYAKNASYMLQQGVGNQEEIIENLRLISGQVDRASRIISQMRELARRTERQMALVDVNEKLRETVEFVMPQLKLSGVEVTFALADDLPQVLGDAVRLEQVFLNLLTNARQAMQDKELRRLDIRTRHESGVDLPVVIEIADTGKGFSPEVAEKLFTPFFSTKRAGHGTGLGLSISLSIMKDHQGSIEAVGPQGEGATFTVRLPVGREMSNPV